MKTFVALLAMLLGVVGVLLLLASGVAVWRGESVVVDRTERATARTSERLSKVEGRLNRLEGKVKNITVDVEGIRTAATRLVGGAVKEALDRTEFNQLIERLSRLLEQSEGLGGTLEIAARLFEEAADLSAQLEGNPDRTDRLRGIAETLEKAAAELAGIRTELSEFRLREATVDPQKLADLCARSRGPLERMANGIASIRQHSVEARESLEHLRQKARFWIRTVAVLLSLLFVWLGLGQVCLIGWGWNRLRSTPSP